MPIFELKLNFQAKGKRSRAVLKILQLELWLEPARPGLITKLIIYSHYTQYKDITPINHNGQFQKKINSLKLSCQNHPGNEAHLWKLDSQPLEFQI